MQTTSIEKGSLYSVVSYRIEMIDLDGEQVSHSFEDDMRIDFNSVPELENDLLGYDDESDLDVIEGQLWGKINDMDESNVPSFIVVTPRNDGEVTINEDEGTYEVVDFGDDCLGGFEAVLYQGDMYETRDFIDLVQNMSEDERKSLNTPIQ